MEVLVEYFQMIIVETARETFGFKKFNEDSVNWVDKKIHKLLRKKKRTANKISKMIFKMKKHYGSIENASKLDKKKLKQLKHKMRRIQKKIKKKKYKNVIESTENIERILNSNSVNNEKVFFDMVNKISKRQERQIPPLRDEKTDEIIARTDMEIAN